MTFLLDHCIWKETENILQKRGYHCISLKELNKTEVSNGEVIAIARLKKAILITRDQDFSNLSLYPLKSHEGIILLQITPPSMQKVHKILLEALQTIPAKSLKGNLLIVTNTTYRLHRQKS